MRQIEARALERGISHEMLMEEAGKKIAEHALSFVQKNALKTTAIVLAGKGNNGGDAYVAARHLLQLGFSVVVWQAFDVAPDSLLRKMKRRYEARGGKVQNLGDTVPYFPEEGIIIDGLFGTGFHGQIDSNTKNLIQKANQSRLPILSIDIPSGIDAASGAAAECAIIATETIAIECPKIGYFLQSAMCNIGRVVSYSIGLQEFVQEQILFAFEQKDATLLLPHIVRTRHKYQAGHVVGLAGSHGMAGAALLASWSSLHAGAGIVRLLHPEKHSCEFSGVPLEVVRVPYETEETVRHTVEKASALFIGPGLGSGTAILDSIWPECRPKKCVIDADAIHWMAKTGVKSLENAIITPHLGECAKLLGKERIECVTLELLNEVQAFAQKNTAHIILKGAPSFLFSPTGPIYTVLHGDPGMATAGSGDVLTGVLAGLLSQGLHPLEAMQLGVWLHSRAGELAASTHSSYSVTASAIMNHIGQAFKELLAKKDLN